jgi:hypothetical protein
MHPRAAALHAAAPVIVFTALYAPSWSFIASFIANAINASIVSDEALSTPAKSRIVMLKHTPSVFAPPPRSRRRRRRRRRRLGDVFVPVFLAHVQRRRAQTEESFVPGRQRVRLLRRDRGGGREERVHDDPGVVRVAREVEPALVVVVAVVFQRFQFFILSRVVVVVVTAVRLLRLPRLHAEERPHARVPPERLRHASAPSQKVEG